MITAVAASVVPAVPLEEPVLATHREHLIRASASLWRVVDRREHVTGHLRVVATPEGTRYRAERYVPRSGGFVEVGSFWSPDDAVAVLRC